MHNLLEDKAQQFDDDEYGSENDSRESSMQDELEARDSMHIDLN